MRVFPLAPTGHPPGASIAPPPFSNHAASRTTGTSTPWTSHRIFSALDALVSNAQTEVLIENAYFVPRDHGVELTAALHARGVKVRVLTKRWMDTRGCMSRSQCGSLCPCPDTYDPVTCANGQTYIGEGGHSPPGAA
jgi:phosphatidylserine/phosphatidylglycerophosphate/cardiolipin synthase-like enzyme